MVTVISRRANIPVLVLVLALDARESRVGRGRRRRVRVRVGWVLRVQTRFFVRAGTGGERFGGSVAGGLGECRRGTVLARDLSVAVCVGVVVTPGGGYDLVGPV